MELVLEQDWVQRTIEITLLLPRSVGRSYCTSAFLLTSSFLLSTHFTSRSSRNPNSDGTCRRHSDAQVSNGI